MRTYHYTFLLFTQKSPRPFCSPLCVRACKSLRMDERTSSESVVGSLVLPYSANVTSVVKQLVLGPWWGKCLLFWKIELRAYLNCWESGEVAQSLKRETHKATKKIMNSIFLIVENYWRISLFSIVGKPTILVLTIMIENEWEVATHLIRVCIPLRRVSKGHDTWYVLSYNSLNQAGRSK